MALWAWAVNAALAATVEADDVAHAGRYYLEHTPALDREDCSGLVEGVHALAGAPLTGSVRTLWARAEAEGRVHARPRPGDVAFFDDTYDANENGLPDDPLTHVAVVVDVIDQHTVVLVHRARTAGIEEIRLDTELPDVYREGDIVRNDHLAVRGWGNADGERLTGQLIHGYASFADDAPRLVAARTPPAPTRAGGPRVRPTASPGRERPVPSNPVVLLTDDPIAMARVLDGRRLRWSDLRELPCAEVAALRDAVYVRHGYVFQDPLRNAPFNGRIASDRQPSLTPDEVAAALTGPDRYNLDVLDGYARWCLR